MKENNKRISSMLLAVSWYPFKKDTNVLFYKIGNDDVGMLSIFVEMAVSFCEDVLENNNLDKYDYIVCGSDIEREKDIIVVLSKLKDILKPDGVLLIVAHNRLGIEYLCGEKDPYTGYALDGLDNYRHADISCGRSYSRSEWKDMVATIDLTPIFYSIFPSMKNPNFIYREDCYPNEEYRSRVFYEYTDRFGIWLNELFLFEDFQRERLLHNFANGYIIECFQKYRAVSCDVTQVTIANRSRKNSFFTIIHGNDYVEKKNVYPEGEARFWQLIENHKNLRNHGINTVEDLVDTNGRYTLSYIDAPTGQEALRSAANKSKSKFLAMLDNFVELIYKSSERVSMDEEKEIILKKAYLDMIPLNSFFYKGKFIFFDQEYCMENVPAKVIVTRTIDSLRRNNAEIDFICEDGELYKRYDILDCYDKYNKIQWHFLDKYIHVHNRNNIYISDDTIEESMALNREYIDKCETICIPYNPELLVNIGSRKLVIFGSGKYADDFWNKYGKFFEICAVVDNNTDKIGKIWHNIPIASPSQLKDMGDDVFVLICIRQFRSVKWQTLNYGIKNIGIYNIACEYKLPENEGKQYKIGYVAGAFDMFHIGHLNLLRKAKERCEYLIVGVISDERTYELKRKYPIIPCNERMQIVAGCRYVDKVEELPIGNAGIMDAYNMFHFDCMFSGDDHANDPGWLAERERLRKLGSDIVFVPYTKETSSTEIRQKVKGKISNRPIFQQ